MRDHVTELHSSIIEETQSLEGVILGKLIYTTSHPHVGPWIYSSLYIY